MSALTARTRPNFRDLLRPGVAAVRANWRPFVVLQAAALGVVIAYYQVDAIRDVCDAIGRFRENGGILVAIVASIIAGMVLPEVAKAFTLPGWTLRGRGGEFAFLFGLFAYNGALIDVFYGLQARWFGDTADVGTVLTKLVVDQYLFTPLLSLTTLMLVFAWRRHRYRIGGVIGEVRRAGVGRWYVRRVIPVLLPCWAFWGPMVVLIYSLPTGLQIPLWAGAMAAWSLVMVFIGDGDEEPELADVEPGGVAAVR